MDGWRRTARRIGVALTGGLVVLAGVILLPLPGPGSVVIAAGLGILSLEFERPRRWLAQGRTMLRYGLGRLRYAWRHRRRPPGPRGRA